jgi:hypothetical protein
LSGVLVTNNQFRTLDGRFFANPADVTTKLGVPGLVNSSTSIRATDDKPAVESFIKDVKVGQVITNYPGGAGLQFLGCSVDDNLIWRYNSSSPTNNTQSFDLWVDLIVGGKTNVVGNWAASK